MNAVHERAPWVRFCFNTGPMDTVLRVVPADVPGEEDGTGALS